MTLDMKQIYEVNDLLKYFKEEEVFLLLNEKGTYIGIWNESVSYTHLTLPTILLV